MFASSEPLNWPDALVGITFIISIVAILIAIMYFDNKKGE